MKEKVKTITVSKKMINRVCRLERGRSGNRVSRRSRKFCKGDHSQSCSIISWGVDHLTHFKSENRSGWALKNLCQIDWRASFKSVTNVFRGVRDSGHMDWLLGLEISWGKTGRKVSIG